MRKILYLAIIGVVCTDIYMYDQLCDAKRDTARLESRRITPKIEMPELRRIEPAFNRYGTSDFKGLERKSRFAI